MKGRQLASAALLEGSLGPGVAGRPWHRSGDRTVDWPMIGALAAGFVATVWVAGLLLARIDGLSAPPYDLAFFQQVVWNVGRNGTWVSNFASGNFLGLHFSPILLVPAIVEAAVWPDVRVLSLFHAVAIGAMTPAAFLFIRALLRPSRYAAAVAAGLTLMLPAWASMQGVIRSDFHPEAAGVTLAFLAGWAGLTRRLPAMWLLALLALATREDVAYAVGIIGVAVAVRSGGRRRRQAWLLTAAASLWAVVVFGVVMPAIRGGADSDTATYYAWLGGGFSVLVAPITKTGAVLAVMTRPTPWFVVAGMLGAVAALPLLRPRWLLLVLPPLVALLLSRNAAQGNLTLQYPLVLMTPVLVAAAFGARRALVFGHRLRGRWRLRRLRHRGAGERGHRTAGVWTAIAAPTLLLAVALPSIAGAWVQGSLPPFDRRDPAFQPRPGAIEQLVLVAERVPPTGLLVSDEGLLAPLAGRATIGRMGSFPPPDAYVLLDRNAWAPTSQVAWLHRQVIAALASGPRPTLADDGRFVLWGPEPGSGAP